MSTPTKWKSSIFWTLLELISIHGALSSPARVMRSLSDAVKESKGELERDFKNNGGEWSELIVDEECAFVENLIGAALITCQAEITSIWGHVKHLRARANEAGNIL